VSDDAPRGTPTQHAPGWLQRLRERGVLRVAASYAVIAWLLLQIADVVIDPLGLPKWVMTALIIAAAVGFPIAVALAWFREIGPHGIAVDTAARGVPRPTVRGLRHYADALVIGVLLIAVVVLAVRQSDLGKPKPPENPAIAVLPFENLSGDPEQEYFSDGLAEEMLDRLGRVPGLKVIARSSSFSFKDKDVDARTVAQKLGVTTVLEGSVRRDGRRLKLSARLIDGVTGQQSWSGSYDREVTDIFAVQAELAGAVVEAIIPAAWSDIAAPVAPPTSDLDAYDLYLAARTQAALRLPASLRKAVELMEQAVRLDPQFARGQAQLAASLLFLRACGDDSDPEQAAVELRRAEAAIHRALALDPDLSEAHDAYGNLLRDADRPGAEEEYKRALELNPNNAVAWHDYAVLLGRFARRPFASDRATARALELDPRQPVTWANYLSKIVSRGRDYFERERARAIQVVGDMPGAVDRFPNPIWAEDRAGYRDELEGVMHAVGGTPGALDDLMMPSAVVIGFPIQVMKAGLVKAQRQADADLPPWINFFRAWAPVDPQRAARVLPRNGESRHGVNYERSRLFLEAEALGLAGDWTRLDVAFAGLQKRFGDHDPAVRSIMAFWLTVQGRHRDAATSLAMAEPVPVTRMPPVLGNDTGFGLMEPMIARVYRETGRSEEATRRVRERLDVLRAERDAAGKRCQWDERIEYASIAANEGLRDEAVAVLRAAMNCGDLPYAFQPRLPWFKALEGYPPYDELLRERQRRVEQIRAELQRLEATALAAANEVASGTAVPSGTVRPGASYSGSPTLSMSAR
jgi:TolB-like protein